MAAFGVTVSNEAQLQPLLRAAIAAAKAGEREQARDLLLKVVAADEASVHGWLWLSAVVDSAEEQRICLEYVLALDPGHAAARLGLERLAPALPSGPPEPPLTPDDRVIRQVIAPVSPAAAVLYPERQVKEWRWRDPTAGMIATPPPAFESGSRFDDVWNSDETLCAYCAQPLEYKPKRCPHCRRKLIGANFRYPNPSANLHIYWVFLLGAGQLYLIQIMVFLVSRPLDVAAVVFNAVAGLALLGLAAAVYFRQFWAYVASLVILFVLLVAALNSAAGGGGLAETIGRLIADETARRLASGTVIPILSGLVNLLRPMQMAAVALGLLYGVFLAGPDFARDTVRYEATLTKGQRPADEFYALGKQHAARGRWATAVLHFQRAAAQEPRRIAYQRALGQAYAVLGFYERSLDVLEPAEQAAVNEAMKNDLAALIGRVRQFQASN